MAAQGTWLEEAEVRIRSRPGGGYSGESSLGRRFVKKKGWNQRVDSHSQPTIICRVSLVPCGESRGSCGPPTKQKKSQDQSAFLNCTIRHGLSSEHLQRWLQ
eukprot:3151258-Rhodomonas_salina.1